MRFQRRLEGSASRDLVHATKLYQEIDATMLNSDWIGPSAVSMIGT